MAATTYLISLEYVPVRLGRLPGVFVPSYHLNYFELAEGDGKVVVKYRVVAKAAPRDLTLLERLLILGRRAKGIPPIPEEIRIGTPKGQPAPNVGGAASDVAEVAPQA